MSRTLIIDDLRTLSDDMVDSDTEVVYARTPDEGLTRLAEGGWDEIVLDHDLGMNPATGQKYEIWPCVEYIENTRNSFRETSFVVVSSNPYGAAQIEAALQVAGLSSIRLTEGQKSAFFKSQE